MLRTASYQHATTHSSIHIITASENMGANPRCKEKSDWFCNRNEVKMVAHASHKLWVRQETAVFVRKIVYLIKSRIFGSVIEIMIGFGYKSHAFRNHLVEFKHSILFNAFCENVPDHC